MKKWKKKAKIAKIVNSKWLNSKFLLPLQHQTIFSKMHSTWTQ
jgi:hypothetical protein